ncbi:c-type cytochrome [Bradyrhizobium tropiciagri]|uniref:c-type cytochrome n=1 Tax=Bradyrhizobium tropiciagri TaxID=312253 RepID=UPI001BA797DF|nr:c-type cytochrome [Bradyrhizobium tropiciagri]MBR0873585.1 c-type cytochrome [Bradyrhizobium tropiciagri]
MTLRSIVRAVSLRQAKAALMAAAVTIGAANAANAAGDPARGATLYQGCGDCHSIDANDVGPMHKGVVGRLAGTAAGYSYSPALKASKIVWTEQNLDKWLSGPDTMVPGTKMFYEVPDAKDRADIIAFLKQNAK